MISLWELKTTWAWSIRTPGVWLAGFMQETTRNCYILNIKAVGLMVLEKIFKVFPILSLLELYVAMATRVPIQSAQNLMQPFPQLIMLYMKFDQNRLIDIRDMYYFERVDGQRRRTPDHCHINTSNEPSAPDHCHINTSNEPSAQES